MKRLTIKYKPIFLLPFFLSVSRSIPENWQEVTEAQLSAFEKLAANRISENSFIAEMFEISPWLVFRISEFEKYCILDKLSFMMNGEGYPARCKYFGRAASISNATLHSPFYYIQKQAEKSKL